MQLENDNRLNNNNRAALQLTTDHNTERGGGETDLKADPFLRNHLHNKRQV